jgi:hypothetical protein
MHLAPRCAQDGQQRVGATCTCGAIRAGARAVLVALAGCLLPPPAMQSPPLPALTCLLRPIMLSSMRRIMRQGGKSTSPHSASRSSPARYLQQPARYSRE